LLVVEHPDRVSGALSAAFDRDLVAAVGRNPSWRGLLRAFLVSPER
jgi:hypothetical protein